MNDQTSPVIHKGTAKLISFSDAMQEVINGNKITRLEWSNNDEYSLLKDGLLLIHTKGADHKWIVSEADMIAIDWCILPKVN